MPKRIINKKKSYEPLPPTYSARTTVFLLFFHFSEHSVLLYLNQVATFLFTKTKPKFLDSLSLLSCTCAPDLVCTRLALLGRRRAIIASIPPYTSLAFIR